MEGHALLLDFENQGPDFALGFETGRIWAMLQLDLFPGTGAVTRAWEAWRSQLVIGAA